MNWLFQLSQPYNNQEVPTPTGDYFLDNCTVESAIEVIQALLNKFMADNPTSPITAFLRGYYCNPQGYVKLSARYSSKMAGIIDGQGANLWYVWQSFAQHGLVPQNVYPDPTNPDFTWDEYMADVPDGIVQYGSYSATFFKVIPTIAGTNGWNAPIPNVISLLLDKSPISIAGAIGKTVDGVEQYAGIPIYQHCRVIYNIDEYVEVLDNYPLNGTLLRKLVLDYPMPAMITAEVQIV